MARLKAKQRDALPDSAFVFPETREFPIHDREHAYTALRLSGRVSSDKQAKVRAAVCRKWKIGCNLGKSSP